MVPGEFGSVWDHVKNILGAVEGNMWVRMRFFSGLLMFFRGMLRQFCLVWWIWSEFGRLQSVKIVEIL